MSDEYSVDAKYKRDNVVAEHHRYAKALRQIVEEHEAPLFRSWDDYYEWVQKVALDALEPQEPSDAR